MTIVLVIIAVVVAALFAKFYPKKSTTKVEEKATWDFTPKAEPVVVKTPEVIIEAPIAETPKVDTKPKAKKKPAAKKMSAKKKDA